MVVAPEMESDAQSAASTQASPKPTSHREHDVTPPVAGVTWNKRCDVALDGTWRT
jgi:hypothetical protein